MKDRFIELSTGDIYEITHISEYSGWYSVKYRKPTYYDWVQVMNPLRHEELQYKIKRKDWIPDTPAARTLYGHETRKR